MAENPSSQPTLLLPVIPADFETKCGTSKTDFAKAIFQLLASASVTGITPTGGTPYDLARIQSQLEALQTTVDKTVARTPRRVIMNGVINGIIVVPFQSLPSTNYQVDVAFSTPNETLPDALQWSIVAGTKTVNQVTLRINGNAGTYGLEVTITPMDGI